MNILLGRTYLLLAGAVAYSATVLGVDYLAATGSTWPLEWRILRWQTSYGVDLFKLVFWFLVPFGLCIPRMDWGAFGLKRWRRIDYIMLAGLLAVGLAAILAIPLFSSLRHTYPGLGQMAHDAKWYYATVSTFWTLSWIVGWEFLHRYFLLRPLSQAWPRCGWLLVPALEGVYHLQKPLLEAAGMVALSLIVTPWAMKRRNVLLPFLVHLAIELELLTFRILT